MTNPVAEPRRRWGMAGALTALLAAQLVVSIASMAGVMALNLHSGFNAYLRARDQEHLVALAGRVAARIGENSGADKEAATEDLAALDLRGLVQQMAGPPPPPPGPPPGAPPDDFDQGAAGPPRPPPPGPPDDFGGRLGLFRADGGFIMGAVSRMPPDSLAAPVTVGGKIAAVLRLAPAAAPASVDAMFLHRQYEGIALAAVLLLGLSIAAATWLARAWARPLLKIRAATGRIAGGDFAARLAPSGAAELADAMANINQMAAALGRLEQARRSWLAQISHELRTPLTVLRGELEALSDGVRPLVPAAVASLSEEVLALSAIIEDLHLLAMSDLGRLRCDFAPADPAALVRHAVDRFAARAAGQNLSLAAEIAEIAAPVRWDAGRIGQVLANLLENSCRYTDAPGRILVRLEPATDGCRIIVEDSAPGVAASEAASLLKPFYRVDATSSRARGGSGLGLAVCAAIIQAHGGTLEITSSPLGGLCATLSLPHAGPPA